MVGGVGALPGCLHYLVWCVVIIFLPPIFLGFVVMLFICLELRAVFSSLVCARALVILALPS